jgi:hypothetical protein
MICRAVAMSFELGASCWQRRPQIAFRGLLVGCSLVEFALRYCQVLIELAKPRQI